LVVEEMVGVVEVLEVVVVEDALREVEGWDWGEGHSGTIPPSMAYCMHYQ
jgi:hypothetical protein